MNINALMGRRQGDEFRHIYISKNCSVMCFGAMITAVLLYISMVHMSSTLKKRNPRPILTSKPILSQEQDSHTAAVMQHNMSQHDKLFLSEGLNSYTEQSEKDSHQQSHNDTHKESDVTQPPHHSGLGYMLSLGFSDQGTGSFVNILSFLCLASELRSVRIVEPFLVGSLYGQNVSANWTKETKFSDVFDLDMVSRYAISRNYKPLVPYDTFLKDAPRKLLVAQIRCSGLSICRSCGHEDVLKRGQIFSRMNGFEMVGHVCINYGSNGKITLKEMENQLYAEYRKSEVVIMFPHFGGVDSGKFSKTLGYRLFLSPSSCYRGKFFVFSKMRPSTLVASTASKYIHTYFHGERYISVMIRIEMILRSKLRSKEAPHLTEHCLNNLYWTVEKIKKQFDINNVFLCLDVGMYGSGVFRDEETMNPILPYFNRFVSQTVKEGMTLSEWDDTFSNVTLRQDPGFVAVMQKVIAARGDVLVLLGAESSFQSSTCDMYNSLHKNKNVFKLKTSCGL